MRANYTANDLRIFGIRAELHHEDATPHWHMLLYVAFEQADSIQRNFRICLEEDENELITAKARKAPLHTEAIDS
ncbi:replication endonuclease [Providencia huaxiensis]|uniref:replication endonuclease n=1 Tax=Providencia huaxiensis TaxID=2027290 RepID=UPI0034DCF5AA